MDNDWSLEMTFRGPHGEKYTVAFPVDAYVAEGEFHTPIPRDVAIARAVGFASSGGFEQLVEVMRRREFRKDEFKRVATKLGILLAERMEDKEGWHGTERAERLRAWGKP